MYAIVLTFYQYDNLNLRNCRLKLPVVQWCINSLSSSGDSNLTNIVKPNRIDPMMAKKLDLKCPEGLKLELYH